MPRDENYYADESKRPESDDSLPGPDPRTSKEYIHTIMPPKETSMSYYEPDQVEAPARTLVGLAAQLNQLEAYAGSLGHRLRELNDRLVGSIPQPENSGGAKGASPEGCINHCDRMANAINGQLFQIEAEIRRLEAIIGN